MLRYWVLQFCYRYTMVMFWYLMKSEYVALGAQSGRQIQLSQSRKKARQRTPTGVYTPTVLSRIHISSRRIDSCNNRRYSLADELRLKLDRRPKVARSYVRLYLQLNSVFVRFELKLNCFGSTSQSKVLLLKLCVIAICMYVCCKTQKKLCLNGMQHWKTSSKNVVPGKDWIREKIIVGTR